MLAAFQLVAFQFKSPNDASRETLPTDNHSSLRHPDKPVMN
ncbi:hypothetical protein RISK_003064 [Rhodopirellula islandica]|uniref:Uncharacterized protein n=1 Tax=Rhodopirellula islandica TaxID=595434 RepID=A0A0J1BE44_RHOIS|nr:hypothetical protein RISK_003064 [Rhodopirellula islandica]